MMPRLDIRLALVGLLLGGGVVAARGDEPLKLFEQAFESDPLWDGFRNHLAPEHPRIVRQDFGYRRTAHAGGAAAGEIGGFVQRSPTPAYYAKSIAPLTLNDRLAARGKLAVRAAEGSSGVMIGWFQDRSRGWRTPNSLGFRIDGNGGKYWLLYEYGTDKWHTGGGGAFEGKQYQKTPTPPFKADGAVHEWAIDYYPQGNGGQGLITFQVDHRSYQLPLAAGHRAEGAVFNRFGIWNVQTPGKGAEIYLDDLVVNGRPESFDEDPGWESLGNPAEFAEQIIRPYHNFGYSRTSRAGGGAGEIGGIVFRDEKPAYYAGKTNPLSLADELRASGKLALVKAASDSGVYFGWFDSASKQANDTPENERRQRNYLGLLIEGPSRVGHYFRPGYGTRDGSGITAGAVAPDGRSWPVIYPDARVHTWSLRYNPRGAAGAGQIEVTLDDQGYTMDLERGHQNVGATFDRFGIFTMQIGGPHVEMYLDDVSYTGR
jgi:hypothetical protein